MALQAEESPATCPGPSFTGAGTGSGSLGPSLREKERGERKREREGLGACALDERGRDQPGCKPGKRGGGGEKGSRGVGRGGGQPEMPVAGCGRQDSFLVCWFRLGYGNCNVALSDI